MTDIATTWNAEGSFGDWSILTPTAISWTDEEGNSIRDELGRPVDSQFTTGGILAVGDDLFTAALISIFTDAVADPDDPLPTSAEDPRGWWAGPIGSKIWLRSRSRATELTRSLIRNDLEQALAWMIVDQVVISIEIDLEWIDSSKLGAKITFRRSDGSRHALAFVALWENA